MTDEEFHQKAAEMKTRFLRQLTPEEVENVRKFGQASAEMNEDYRAVMRRRLIAQANIPPAHRVGMENPDPCAAIEEVRCFLGAGGPKSSLLVLGGKGGVGKSFAAAWATVESWGRFIQAGELVQQGQFKPEFWEGLAKPMMLAIDDLGTEGSDAPWLAGCLFDLLNWRCGGTKKTIVTTNLNGPDFMQRYAAGNFSRLERRWKDFGTFVVVKARSEP